MSSSTTSKRSRSAAGEPPRVALGGDAAKLGFQNQLGGEQNVGVVVDDQDAAALHRVSTWPKVMTVPD